MLLRKSFLLSIALIITAFCQAQNFRINGWVKSNDSVTNLAGVTILLQGVTDSTERQAGVTDSLGRYVFNGLKSGASYKLTFNSIGFATTTKTVKVDAPAVDMGFVFLAATADVTSSVTVTASAAPIVQKGDTVQFSASQYKVNPDASAEDLAKKIPGITVENGQVKANGENVQKVTIDGRELFGDDATAALKNLPAEIIDKIQVFDRLSDQAQFTGFDDGSSTKGINIVTKASMRNGQFGRIFAGYGTDDHYWLGGNTTFLNGDRKISLVGNFNNINQQNFASQDLLGVTNTNTQRGGGGGGGGQRGGGQRGGGSGGGGNAGGGNAGGGQGNFLVGQQTGINKTNAVGINYADNWGKKITVSGSYFFNNSDNTTNEDVTRNYVLEGIPSYNQKTLSNSKNTNHRFSMRFEYKIDSSNELIITPSVSIQDNTSYRNVTTSFFDPNTLINSSRTTNANTSTRSGNNINNNILWRHTFAKKGRTFSVNLTNGFNKRNGDVYTTLYDTTFTSGGFTDSTSQRFTDQVSSGYNVSANMVYTEPISQNSQLQFNYNPSYTKNKADQEAYQYEIASGKYSIFDPNLSSKFENTQSAQNAGLAYRYGTRDNQLSFGVNYQRTDLHSEQEFPRQLRVLKTFTDYLPNAMLRFKLSAKSNIRIMYRANTTQPSVNQLQDVYDVTNLPFVTAGNPNLSEQYSHTINTRYTFSNTGKGVLLVGNVYLQTAKNYITNATFVPLQDSALTPDITLKAGQQLTKPVNLNGYLSLRSFLTFAMPLKFIKSSINFNGGVQYSKLPGIINNQSNISKTLTYTAGAVVASNVSQYIDFTLSYSGNFNDIKNDLQPTLNTKYYSHLASLQMNLLSKTGWFFQNDLNNQLYSGLSAGYNQSYFLWNMSVGKKFLANQKGELKLSVFDLLQQNQSLSRNVTETYVEDIRNQVLQRYFMLTFTYNLRNFGGAAAAASSSSRRTGGNFGGNRPLQ